MGNNWRTLKIADFGTVRELDESELTARVGTIIYMAPEVFATSDYTTKCDVFSYAITLCEMFTRQKPYATEIRKQIKRDRSNFIEQISKIDAPLRPILTCDIPTSIRTIIER